MSMPEKSVASSERNSAPKNSSSCGRLKPLALRAEEDDFVFDGESRSNSLFGDPIMPPSPRVGELNTEGPRLGVNFSMGVGVRFLLQLLDISPRTLPERARSRRGLFVDRFSGEPFSAEAVGPQ